ncbi:hypothetical protein ACFLYO_11610 [Chloroflexota bacterium]
MSTYLLKFLLGTLICLLLSGGVIQAQDAALDACQQMVDTAIDDLASNCANMVPNSACYGGGLVEAVFYDSFAVPVDVFTTPGDHVDLRMVEQIISEGHELDNGWGVTVMQTQGSVPFDDGTSPIMILFGDSSIINGVLPEDAVDIAVNEGEQTPMQTFTLELGEDNPNCPEAITGLMLQLTAGNEVNFQGNKADLQLVAEICTNVFFRQNTPEDSSLILEVTSGQVTIFADTIFPIILTTGYQITLPLDEDGYFIVPEANEEYQAIFDTIQIMSDEELARLARLEDLPLNVLECPFTLPEIIRPSGVGDPDTIIIPSS